MMSRGLWRLMVAALVCMASAVLIACGDDDSADSSTSGASTAEAGTKDELVTVKLGYAPLTQMESVWLGDQNGLFEKNGIKLDWTATNNPAQLPLALESGQFDVVVGTWGTWGAVSRLGGLKLDGIAPLDDSGAEESQDSSWIVAPKDSGLTSMKDLVGKTVAVNSVKTLAETLIGAAARNAGVDPKQIKLVPIPFPAMAAALKSGRVDAVSSTEPFMTILESEVPLNYIAGVTYALAPEAPVTGLFSTEKYIEENPETVRKIQDAVKESNQYAIDHMDEMRAKLPEFSKDIAPELAAKMKMPRWVTEINMDGMQRVFDAMTADGVLKGKVDAETVTAEYPMTVPSG